MLNFWSLIFCMFLPVIGSFNFEFPNIELTIMVKPREQECFYQYSLPKQILRFEYRVIDADYSRYGVVSELKINFYVRSPEKKTVLKYIKKSHGIETYAVAEAGDYEICFDNHFSKFSTKTVYFEITIDITAETYRWMAINESLLADKRNNGTITLLRRTANKVKDDLETIKHYQDTYRAVEA
ncbi:Transmembrane emp24 domain-containing protein 1, partial [Stegodyphus mimosarum]